MGAPAGIFRGFNVSNVMGKFFIVWACPKHCRSFGILGPLLLKCSLEAMTTPELPAYISKYPVSGQHCPAENHFVILRAKEVGGAGFCCFAWWESFQLERLVNWPKATGRALSVTGPRLLFCDHWSYSVSIRQMISYLAHTMAHSEMYLIRNCQCDGEMGG